MDRTELKGFAGQAKIAFFGQEEEELYRYFLQIEKELTKIKSIKTDAEPLITVSSITDRMRDDIAEKHITREKLLSGAVDEAGGYFRTPKTLE